MRPGSSERGRIPFLVLLAAGLLLRAAIFELPHREGDERIYAALIEQLRAGRGYTLAGHPILDQDWMIRDQYDTPVFYHPPAGIAWMALFQALLGPRGLDVAQLAAFVVFFAAMWGLAREALPAFTPATRWAVGALAAATPIVAHVSVHRWLDGPQVAAVAVGAWLTVRALRRGGRLSAVGAGAALGVAMLVKVNAAVAVPPILALAWAVSPERPARERVGLVLGIAGVAALAVLPWIVAAPGWAGKPSARLVAENPFVRHVTVERSAWVYSRLLPTTIWTLVPSLAVGAVLGTRGRERSLVGVLLLWIATVTGLAIVLGGLGYSKLLRYVVLVTPATVLLAGWAVAKLEQARPGRRWLAALLAVGFLLEIAHGVQTMRVYPDRAWIRPLTPWAAAP
jgi:4-amino-4-deoxy-L-arabinose transferase-like glycosyltransferase